VDGMLVKFEDLVSGGMDLRKIANHLGVGGLKESVLQRKINSPKEDVKKPKISLLDRAIIITYCRKLMEKLGYLQ